MRELPRFEIAKGLRKIAGRQSSDEKTNLPRPSLWKPPSRSRLRAAKSSAASQHLTGRRAKPKDSRAKWCPSTRSPNGKGKTAYTQRIPRGVIYGITPFNFPLNLVASQSRARARRRQRDNYQAEPANAPDGAAFRRGFYGKRVAGIGAADRADGREIYRIGLTKTSGSR